MYFYREIKNQSEADRFLLNADYFTHCKIVEMAYFCQSNLLADGGLDMSDETNVRLLFFLQGADFAAVDMVFENVRTFRFCDNMDLDLSIQINRNSFIVESKGSGSFYCEAGALKYNTEININQTPKGMPFFAFANPYQQMAVDFIVEISSNKEIKTLIKETDNIILLIKQGDVKMAFEWLFSILIDVNYIFSDKRIFPACLETGKSLGLDHDSQLSVNFWPRFTDWINNSTSQDQSCL